MTLKQPIITLITDFGTKDGYVGAMKGVMLSICPQLALVDITHAIPPQNVFHAAFSLFNAARFFPVGTVHLVVVDPGVGTPRRPLAFRAGGMTFVGPDNGVLSIVMREMQVEMVVALENAAYQRSSDAISHTFHGRDIFAPAAAHLAAGVPIEELGPGVADWISLPIPMFTLRPPHELVGEVLYLDHFGNVVTNIGVLEWRGHEIVIEPFLYPGRGSRILPRDLVVECRGHRVGLYRTYGEVDPGTLLALVGSNGLLEIAIRDGNAAKSLGFRPGDSLVLTSKSDA